MQSLYLRATGALSRCFTRWSLLVLFPILPGCASYHAMPFVGQGSASTIVEHRNREGLHVAVRNLTKTRVAIKHFGRDLMQYGYVPVMLLVELDATSDSAFNVRRDEIRLVLRDGTRLKTSNPETVAEEVAYSHWRSFFGFLLLLPGPFVSSSVNSANQDLEEDYTKKSLRSVRISPNMRSFEGAVFFALADDVIEDFTMEDAFLEFVAYKEASRSTGSDLGKRLDFPVHFFE